MLFNSKEYWENRYKNNETSGDGSYKDSARVKADYINTLIKKYNIKKINDLGHGDGNQISLINGFDLYTGYDVSTTVRKKCIEKFESNPSYIFIDDIKKFVHGDLAMSLDVIYHIIEENIYKEYLETLFSLGNFILIYTVNENLSPSPHVLFRKFTPYIEDTFTNFRLIDSTPGFYGDVKFFLYKKVSI